MKILFVVPPFYTNMGFVPNGIGIVATMAKIAGLDVRILLATHNETTLEFNKRMIDEISTLSIDVVAMGGHSAFYTDVKQMIKLAKEAGAITILGGYIVNTLPKLVPENIGADYCVYGEGEYTFIELMEALSEKRAPINVKGLIYKENGELITTPPRDCIVDLDDLPFVDGELCHFGYSLMHASVFRVYYSRGCPNRCTFCHVEGPNYRTKSIDYIFRELDYYLSLYGNEIRSKVIQLDDRTFSTEKSRLLEFCRRIKTYNLPYTIQLRIDSVDEECLAALKDSGCSTVGYGLESADNRVLKSMRKNNTIEQAEETLELTEKNGLQAVAYLIIGDTEDDLESIKKSEDFYRRYALKYHMLEIILIAIYPGTALYNYAVQNGYIKNELEYIEAGCPYINISKIPDAVYKLLKQKYARYTMHKYYIRNELLLDKHGDSSVSKSGALSYTGYCPFCYAKIRVTELISDTRRVDNRCPQCTELLFFRRNTLLPSSDSDAHLISNLVKISLDEYKCSSVVIWGVTNVIRRLLYHSQDLRDIVVRIVDINYQNLTHLTFCGLPIENPEVLRGAKFDYVLTGVVFRRWEIEASLKEMGIEPKFIEMMREK